MKHSFDVLPVAGRAGSLLKLVRNDGFEVLSVADDHSGQQRLEAALSELEESQGGWVNVGSMTGPEWGRRLLPLLDKIRHNDWSMDQGTVLGQYHTEQMISTGVALKDVPEVYSLWGNLRQYSCLMNFLIFDPEAMIEMVWSHVPRSGNHVNLDRYIRMNGDRVKRGGSVAHSWTGVIHSGSAIRTGLVEGGVPLAAANSQRSVQLYPDLKAAIIRGDLSPFDDSVRRGGAAIVKTYCRRSYNNLVEHLASTMRNVA